MPELPEVETIRLGLQKYLVGHVIERVEIRLAKQFLGDPQRIMGAKVEKIRRFGKGLVIDLSNGYSIAVHVKMTGQLIYILDHVAGPVSLYPRPTSSLTSFPPKGTSTPRVLASSRWRFAEAAPAGARMDPSMPVKQASSLASLSPLPSLATRYRFNLLVNKHTHVIFYLDKGSFLLYNDIRQFGWIRVVKREDVLQLPFFKSLGSEPLKDLSPEKFQKLLKGSKTPVKQVLMDQSKIAGVGNIYANDCLFQAGILPTRPANSLTKNEVTLLLLSLEEILRKSIKVGGASSANYVNALGEKGFYQDHFLVYKKDGEACLRCGMKIKRITMSGRGTFYCPVCQK